MSVQSGRARAEQGKGKATGWKGWGKRDVGETRRHKDSCPPALEADFAWA